MIATHNVEMVTFDANHIFLLVDGKEFKVRLDKISPKLKSANEIQRNMFTISPSGYGIHWPMIDEDLSIGWLLSMVKD